MSANEIQLFGDIGEPGITAQQFKTLLAQADPSEELVVRIDSPGGSVFDGLGIYDAIQAYQGPKRCVIESAAFSIASYIAMAFDSVDITPNGYLMIHNPWSQTEGDDEEHAKQASLLSKLKDSMVTAYSTKTGKAAEDVLAIMRAETYLNADEAQQSGFVDRVLAQARPSKAVAKSKLPQRVFAALSNAGSADGEQREPIGETSMSETQKRVAATVKQIKAAYPMAKADFIVKCMEKEMPIEQVGEEIVEEMAEENEELLARIAALEEEVNAYKAKAEEEEQVAKARAEEEEQQARAEEEEEAPAARASRRGVRPVARVASSSKGSAKARWQSAIESYMAKGLNRPEATAKANRANPGLREQMLAEVNA